MKIAADTNVVVRYLVCDDAAQAEAAARAIEQAEVVVLSTVALCEVVWVLRRAYRYGTGEVAGVLRRLIESRGVEVDRPLAEAGRARCDRLVTFDRGFPVATGGVEVAIPS
jgi:predicted nucleic-acid-binding protein